MLIFVVGWLGLRSSVAQDDAPTAAETTNAPASAATNPLGPLQAQIEAARAAVEAQRAQVAAAAEQAEAIEKQLTPMYQDRSSLQIRLERAESLLVVRERSAALIQRQLAQKAQQLNDKAADSSLARREIEAYRAEALAAPKKYAFTEEVSKLKKEQASAIVSQRQLRTALDNPVAQLRELQAKIAQAELQLAETQAKLSERMLAASDQVVEFAPPVLMEVRVTDSRDRPVYEAKWVDLPSPRAEPIRKLGVLLGDQVQLLTAREAQLKVWAELVRQLNQTCEEIREENQDLVWRQYWEPTSTELCESILTRIWSSNERNGYEIGLEGADRLLRGAFGQAARAYEPAGSMGSLAVFPPSAESALRSWDWAAVKAEIKREIDVHVPDATVPVYHQIGLSGLAKIWATTLKLPVAARHAGIIDHMTHADATKVWKTVMNGVDHLALDMARARLTEKQAEQFPELEIGDETRRIWKDYTQADARRAVAMAYFQATAALRLIDLQVLALMQEVMDEQITQPGIRGLDRLLVRTHDKQLERRVDYQVQLTFSKPVQVGAVALGQAGVTPATNEPGPIWQGQVRFEETPTAGQLVVDAFDLTSGFKLDDPATRAEFIPVGEASWGFYEVGADSSHQLRTDYRVAKRSFVLVVDLNQDGAQSQTEALRFFERGGGWQKGDELALFAMRGETVSRLSAFTQDPSVVESLIKGLLPESPEVPAWAIASAGRYLYTQGRGSEKSLQLYTGHQTAGLKPALESIRRMRETASTE